MIYLSRCFRHGTSYDMYGRGVVILGERHRRSRRARLITVIVYLISYMVGRIATKLKLALSTAAT